jgi:hypothetical protein
MEKKIAVLVSLGCLFLAFGVLSLLVIFTKRHPYFLAGKLRLGALIISLSGAAVGCGTSTCYSPVVTCYDPMPENSFTITQVDQKTQSIIMSKSGPDTLSGNIFGRSGSAFSYAVVDSSNSAALKGDIAPADGAFDESNEDFRIVLGHSLAPGSYQLRLFTVPGDSIQDFDSFRQSYPLTITE